MKKQIGILIAGMLVVVPFGLTLYVVFWAGAWLNTMGDNLLSYWHLSVPTGVGAIVILTGIYLVGVLTHFWLFRFLLRRLERLVARLPGIKTIYESTRDLLKLFGGDPKQMGRSVLYHPPHTSAAILAILTNDAPRGLPADQAGKRVAIYMPFSYMFGGVTLYVQKDSIEEIDLPVEQALKLAATAQVTREEEPEPVPPWRRSANSKNGKTR
jgi:uncharacterized membrane protein